MGSGNGLWNGSVNSTYKEEQRQSLLAEAYQASVPSQVVKSDTSRSQLQIQIETAADAEKAPLVPKGDSQRPGTQQKASDSSSSALLPVVYGITNLASVIAIVVANKLVLYTYNFRFAVTLTWLHTIFTALGMVVLSAIGWFEVKRTSLAKSLPVAAVYVGFIVLNNLSIQLNTVGFYQISKIAVTPVVILIEYVCYRKTITRHIAAATSLLLVGVTLCTAAENSVNVNAAGVLVALASVTVSGLYQVWAGAKQKELELSGLQLLHAVAPVAVALLGFMIPLMEPVGFNNPAPDTILGYNLTAVAATWIVVSCVLGLLVTMSTFLFIGATSPLTYNVVGHLKTVGIVGAGILLFGDSMELKKFLGLCMAMSGIVWYSHLKMQEASKAARR